MSEKNTFEDNTEVLDQEYDDEEDGVSPIEEENERIEKAVAKISTKLQPDQPEGTAEEQLTEQSQPEEAPAQANDSDQNGQPLGQDQPATDMEQPAAEPAEEQSTEQSQPEEAPVTANDSDQNEQPLSQDQPATDMEQPAAEPAEEQPTEQPAKGQTAEPNGSEHTETAQQETDNASVAGAPQAGVEPNQAKAILEGLLFIVGDDGITVEQAAQALDISPERVTALFDELQKYYLDDDRGIEIANYGGIYRFLSKAAVHEYAKKLFQLGKHSTLSQSALETLAIIAYKQPITRVEIEEIRGVGADMMLRKLMARDLIRESGRSDAPGRPILYEVTDEFMDTFKLLDLKELPELPKFDNEEESDDLFRK